MSCIPPSFSNGSLQLHQSSEMGISLKEILDKISKITDKTIELIGAKIVSVIPGRLGAANKNQVEFEIGSKGKGFDHPIRIMMLRMMLTQAKAGKKNTKQLFSLDQLGQFYIKALQPIKSEIAAAFSNSSLFEEFGLYFKLSDDEPMGILAQMSKELNLDITMLDVPQKYQIHLKLDPELTKQKSDLVFAMTEESDGVEFSRTTFTIEELEHWGKEEQWKLRAVCADL